MCASESGGVLCVCVPVRVGSAVCVCVCVPCAVFLCFGCSILRMCFCICSWQLLANVPSVNVQDLGTIDESLWG